MLHGLIAHGKMSIRLCDVIALQVSEFLFGDGFAVAPGDKWRVRRRAVAPSLHKAYLQTMIDRVFGPSGLQLNRKLEVGPQVLLLLCFKAENPPAHQANSPHMHMRAKLYCLPYIGTFQKLPWLVLKWIESPPLFLSKGLNSGCMLTIHGRLEKA